MTFYELLKHRGISMDAFLDMLTDDNLKGAAAPSMYDEFGFKTPLEYFQATPIINWVSYAFEVDLTPQGQAFWEFTNNWWVQIVSVKWGTFNNGTLFIDDPAFVNGCSRILGGCIIDEKRFVPKHIPILTSD